jgi:hypothetical protein
VGDCRPPEAQSVVRDGALRGRTLHELWTQVGAQYLLLPATAFWWLDHYQKFRDDLEARYPVIVRNDNTCLIFRLASHAAQL